ncbi:MAG TPA: MBL fold metallo-hydrolase [Polyangiales bacterium]|nr:MBL fold metallo-hydrolase [Polyangiales bacterium]
MAPTWQIGDVSIRRVVEMETPVPYHPKYPLIAEARPDALGHMPWLKPHFATNEGHLLTSIHALVIEAPGLLLIVDTCLGNDKPRRMLGNRALSTEFLALLSAAGCEPERVQAVICTHLHVDHVGWNTRLDPANGRWVPTFPNARYLMGRVEFDHWSQETGGEPAAIMHDSIKPIVDAGLVELVEQDHQLSNEIRLIPTPGHTPGHVSVMIESRGARALITGDVIHHPCQIGEPTWATSFDSDRSAATAMRQQLLSQFADSGVLVIGTHFAHPTAGHITRHGEHYRFDV